MKGSKSCIILALRISNDYNIKPPGRKSVLFQQFDLGLRKLKIYILARCPYEIKSRTDIVQVDGAYRATDFIRISYIGTGRCVTVKTACVNTNFVFTQSVFTLIRSRI